MEAENGKSTPRGRNSLCEDLEATGALRWARGGNEAGHSRGKCGARAPPILRGLGRAVVHYNILPTPLPAVKLRELHSVQFTISSRDWSCHSISLLASDWLRDGHVTHFWPVRSERRPTYLEASCFGEPIHFFVVWASTGLTLCYSWQKVSWHTSV